MTLVEIKDYAILLNLLITSVLGVTFWIISRDRVTNDRISTFQGDVDARFDRHGDRLTKVETALEHGPNRESVGRLHARLDTLQRELAETKGELKGMHKTLDLIHAHMLEKDK